LVVGIRFEIHAFAFVAIAVAGCDQVYGLERDASVVPAWARALEGERWLIPCTGPALAPDLCICAQLDSQPVQLGGPPGSYTIGVEVQGVYENAHYVNFVQAGSGGWVEGGMLQTGQINANRMWLEVDDPPQVYYINDRATDPVDLFVFHARGTIAVTGSSKVTFHASAGDDMTERKQSLANTDVDLPPHPHVDGQFADLVVDSVAPR
jgi:hypothetical protein